MNLWSYMIQFLIAIDQVFNTLLGGFADETLSSRAYRADIKGRIFGKFFRPLIDTIMFFDKNHCFGAYMAEVAKRQLPSDFQKRD